MGPNFSLPKIRVRVRRSITIFNPQSVRVCRVAYAVLHILAKKSTLLVNNLYNNKAYIIVFILLHYYTPCYVCVNHRCIKSHLYFVSRCLSVCNFAFVFCMVFVFLANVNSRSRSLYAIARPSVRSVVCRL